MVYVCVVLFPIRSPNGRGDPNAPQEKAAAELEQKRQPRPWVRGSYTHSCDEFLGLNLGLSISRGGEGEGLTKKGFQSDGGLNTPDRPWRFFCDPKAHPPTQKAHVCL